MVRLKWPDVLKLAKDGNPPPVRKVAKADAEWRQQLTDEQYHVTRQAGTERAFSSEMCSLFEPGRYSCLCCDTLLFDSNEKFESHQIRVRKQALLQLDREWLGIGLRIIKSLAALPYGQGH